MASIDHQACGVLDLGVTCGLHRSGALLKAPTEMKSPTSVQPLPGTLLTVRELRKEPPFTGAPPTFRYMNLLHVQTESRSDWRDG